MPEGVTGTRVAATTSPAARPPVVRAEIPGEGYHRDLIACQVACPVHTDARGYVRAIAAGDFETAYLIARGPNPFASICGRICGAPCEAACRRGRIPRADGDGRYIGNDRPVAIRALKRVVCEEAGPETRDPAAVLASVRAGIPQVARHVDDIAGMLQSLADSRVRRAGGEPVAVIGAGPAGLSAAHDLALLGFRPVVYEAEPVAAGMLALGVPEYRLPRELIRREVEVIERLGVEIRCGVAVGRDVSFAELRREHAAVIIAVGAKRARGLGVPGEGGPRVLGGVDLLRAVALGEPLDLGADIVVIGGGNVAYDVARTVLRQVAWDAARAAARLPGTARVRLVSLETLEEMPADTIEIVEGDEEGIERLNGWGPVEFTRGADGRLTGVLLRRCARVYDEARRFAPIFDDNERFALACDTVLLATGQATDLAFLSDGGGDVDEARPGWPKIDPESLATTAPGVFVAGDLAHGTRLLIDAVASGKRAARSVYRHVTGIELAPEILEAHLELPGYRRENGFELLTRRPVPALEPADRLHDPRAVVERGYDRAAAMCEGSRCLDCGVTPVFDGTRCVLCGGCADVCPTSCLKLVTLAEVAGGDGFDVLVDALVDPGADRAAHAAILKDEDRCIRCALCAMRCPVAAISMERVTFATTWRAAS